MATTIILIVIFISYIGLGVPDSLLGSAWPAIYTELGVDVSNVSIVSLIVSLGTILSSFMSERIVNRFKTAPVAACSTALTVIALLGFSFSKNMLWLCLCAIPQGIGAGSIDVALNNYVAKNYAAAHMNFLHCSYGVGVALSPYIMSLFLKDGMRWRAGYRTMFAIQLAILLILLLSLPVWKRANRAEYQAAASEKKAAVPFSVLLKNPAVRVQWFTFIGSCAIESVCLVWGSTYLVNAKALSPAYGARVITFYFVGMTLGRFLSGFAVKKMSCETVIYIGQACTGLAIVLLSASQNTAAAVIGLFLVGFGNGPFFPNMTQLTVQYFDEKISQAVIGTQMGFAYIAVLFSPLLFGLVAERFGIAFFPLYLLAGYLIMLLSTLVLRKRVRTAKASSLPESGG